MITVSLFGGLGNQLFEYAAARALAHRLGTDFQLDISHVSGDPLRCYGLDAYRIHPTLVLREHGKRIERWQMPYDPKIFMSLKPELDVNLVGYWQSEKYFADIRDILLGELQLRKMSFETAKMAERIKAQSDPVAVHFRFGDYLTPASKAIMGNLTNEYYHAAAEFVEVNLEVPHFFFFSDQPELIPLEYEGVIVDCNPPMTTKSPGRGAEDIYLMSLCRHHIIANSSFSWWGRWLSKEEGICVAPKKWFNSPQYDGKDICPSRWIRI